MERSDVAYLINSTPKYFYILELHILLLKRYAPSCKWPIYFATEVPDHPLCAHLNTTYSVQIIPLEVEHSSFLQSRARAVELLPSTIKYVLPVQEDFLLERYVDIDSITQSLNILDNDENIISCRYMPCPGPHANSINYSEHWKYLDSRYDEYMFTFQATVWRCTDYLKLFKKLLEYISTVSAEKRRYVEIDYNIAENKVGVSLFNEVFKEQSHIAYIRAGKYPNAVYLSPFPYRPTAIVKGVLQPFAKELVYREGFTHCLQNYLV